MNRTLPNDESAETQLLGCCLIDGSATVSLALESGITANSFHEPSRGRLYALMVEMVASGLQVNDATVFQELARRKMLDEVGGSKQFMAISGSVPTAANAAQLVKCIHELATIRTVIRLASELVERGYNYAGDGVPEMLSGPMSQLLALASNSNDPDPSWEEIIDEAERITAELIANKGKPLASTIEFPWRQMNELFGPMQRGQLVILAARTSIGKSSLARPIACHAARAGHNVYFDTLEVKPVRVALQMAATLSRIGVRQVGAAHEQDQEDFMAALRSLKKAGITMSRKDRSLAQIVGRAKALGSQGKIDFMVVDHGGYIDEIATARSMGEKTAAVGRVTKALKNLAVDLNIPVMLLWQLNRGSEKDNNREPMLSDLKDSGSVEEDADKVLFIHRPTENPLTKVEQSSTSMVGDCPRFFQNIIQSKGRDDGTTFMSFYFDRVTASFEPIQK